VVKGAKGLLATTAALVAAGLIAAAAVRIDPSVLWRPGEAPLEQAAANPSPGFIAPVPSRPAPPGSPAALPPQLAQAPGQSADRLQSPAGTASDAEILLTLVRLTMAAVHQANLTGNYTVLRDLGTPAFLERNSAADLTRIFAPIHNAKVDLGAAVLLEPRLSKAALTPERMLHLVGALATKPVPVAFELLFQPIEGVWRIHGIAIVPVPPGGPQASTVPPPARAKPGKPAPKQ
jgi:hypothetical protein